jgi:hypothetical protein
MTPTLPFGWLELELFPLGLLPPVPPLPVLPPLLELHALRTSAAAAPSAAREAVDLRMQAPFQVG